jgi:membrane associated rhomboid family serine protease
MMPPVTRNLIIANFVFFGVEMSVSDAAIHPFALWPVGPEFQPWQLVTYAFLHAGIPHVLFNMLGLYSFGSDIERIWGTKRFITFYFTCAITAGLTQLAVSWITGALYPTVGASGAIFGLLLAFAVMFPQRRVLLLFPPIPMRAPIFALVYGVVELYLGVTGTQEGVAHFAHLGGMAGGLVLMLAWGWRPR